jgi:type IV pilus assembly protein PilE
MRHLRGFTLIEMLVVLAICGVLAAIVYPSYAAHLTAARRLEGQVALLDAMQKQEAYYTGHNTYVVFSSSAAAAEGARFRWWSGSTAAQSAYELSAQACPGVPLQRCVELHAVPGTPKVDASFRDRECGTLTLNSAGQSGATGPRKRCWP